jgi:acetyltransferase-like isoleucine patch superfamily enzyme
MGHVLDGSGAVTRVGAGAVLRAHAYVYNGASVGDRTTVGHYTLLRTNVRIGKDSQLAHYIVAERGSSFGDRVRCSPLSHFTGDFVAEGDVFIGARVATINDKSMLWSKDPGDPHIVPPHVEKGARVGSGCTLASGVRIGEGAIVGSASFVNKDIPPHAVAFGSPARVRPELSADPAAIRRARS